MAHAIFFYIFSAIAIISAIMVTVSKNTVHSVFFLILDFISISCLFIMIGAEFLGMIMLIVYVGAVAVLFLFVVMMLDVDFVELKSGMQKYFLIGSSIGLVLLMELGLVISHWKVAPEAGSLLQSPTPSIDETHNTLALGQILYSDYIYLFQIAGLILLTAMIGAIVLTLRHRTDVKRQNVVDQMQRDPADAMEVITVKSGQGL